MSFLRPHDYLYLIREDNLEKLTSANGQIRQDCEAAALKEVQSHLRYKYDMAKIFPDVIRWEDSTSYDEGTIVSVEAENEWKSGNSYDTGDQVFYDPGDGPNVYVAITSTSTSTDPDASPDFDLVADLNTIHTSQADNNSAHPHTGTDWEKGDPRDPQLKMYVLDVALYHIHSRLQPRMIPEYRIQRRDDAMENLKKIGKGEIWLDLPERKPAETTDEPFRYGGNLRNTY